MSNARDFKILFGISSLQMAQTTTEGQEAAPEPGFYTEGGSMGSRCDIHSGLFHLSFPGVAPNPEIWRDPCMAGR